MRSQSSAIHHAVLRHSLTRKSVKPSRLSPTCLTVSQDADVGCVAVLKSYLIPQAFDADGLLSLRASINTTSELFAIPSSLTISCTRANSAVEK